MKIKKNSSKLLSFVKKYKYSLMLGTIFLLHLFLRFYDMEYKNTFGWDQVDNAWAAKNIIVNHEYPLVGMQAKLNSGLYIGPFYYYLISVVYFITDLDPIASGIFAGITSIFTFFVLFYVAKKIFSEKVALLTVFIYTISYFAIFFDRVQWPVNFIVSVSALAFYALYNIIVGKEKYIFLLTVVLGFSLHVHMTSIFYFLAALLVLPFFPWNRKTVAYIVLSIPIFFLFLTPSIIFEVSKKSSSSKSLSTYINDYYHGVHLVRIFQLTRDAFIKFDSVMRFKELAFLKYILVPTFLFVYFFKKPEKTRFLLCFLIILWFTIPWFVFAVYKGEISDYYFSSTLPLAFMILAYITLMLFELKNYFIKIFIFVFWIYFSYINLSEFFRYKDFGSIGYKRLSVQEAIKRGEVIKFQQGVSDAYFYYLSLRKEGKNEVIKTYFD